MANLTGKQLEDFIKALFEKMKVICIHRLNHTQLIQINPDGPFHSDEHIEFDFLIPYQNICIIGEVTSRSNSDDLRKKYNKFRQNLKVLSASDLKNPQLWEKLGVPVDKLRHFREIQLVKGIFIDTDLQRFDAHLPFVPNIVVFYKAEWELLINYVDSIGCFSKFLFVHLLGLGNKDTYRPFEIREDMHRLMRIRDKMVASGPIGLADIYNFEVSPYDLLPYACVYRHDILPSIDPSKDKYYQRPLIPEKLKAIRKNLLTDETFIFPNSILVVLSKDCNYSDQTRSLKIPDYHGAVSVIDGQHRLFSYADEVVQRRMTNDCKIMVTAIQFLSQQEEEIQKFSAKAFIEINSTQTPVKSTHIDAIAYPVLGQTYPRAISAQIILQLNGRENKKLYGLFDTSQTCLGKIQTTTVITVLQKLTNIQKIVSLQNAARGYRFLHKQGYENLLGLGITDLSEPNKLIQQGVIALERYFNIISKVFVKDWITRNYSNHSSLEFTKFFAAFIGLFNQFIEEGLNWEEVEQELIKIRENVLRLRSKKGYDAILFDPTDNNIPNAAPSLSIDLKFLSSNRTNPTSIQSILPRVA